VPPIAVFLQPLVDVNDAILKFFHNNLGFGWGPSIIGLTFVVRLVILPLTFKQIRSMQALQRLAPEMKKIQERYKDDKKRQQQEIMAFYQEHQVNPLASCFPLLLQLPFFFSLYQTLRKGGAISKQIAASADHGFLFIPNLTKSAQGAVLVTLIVIYVGTQLGSSLVTMVNVQDANQRRIMFALPFIFVFVIIRFPTGLILYWITTNVWTIGQQLAVKRFLPPPEPLPAGAAAAVSGKRGGGDGKDARARDGGAPAKGRGARGGGAAKASADDGGNGGPRKAPPPSPRKKKKRSGRRR
jgi:YidC/Oxa1 family membrane protein insertase